MPVSTVPSRLAHGQSDVNLLTGCHVMYLPPYCAAVPQYGCSFVERIMLCHGLKYYEPFISNLYSKYNIDASHVSENIVKQTLWNVFCQTVDKIISILWSVLLTMFYSVYLYCIVLYCIALYCIQIQIQTLLTTCSRKYGLKIHISYNKMRSVQ